MFFFHPGADPGCRCKGAGVRIRAGAPFAEAVQCHCVKECPDCQNVGFSRQGDLRTSPMKRCTCLEAIGRAELFTRSCIPSKYTYATLRSFQASTDSQHKAKELVESFIQEFPKRKSRGIVMYGDVGRGKTHLMVAAIRQLAFMYGVKSTFIEFTHLCADLKGSFQKGEGASFLMEEVCGVEILALDEMGKGRNTEWEQFVLDEIISRRYNAGLPILATTNYRPGQITPNIIGRSGRPNMSLGGQMTLQDRVGPRVYSRLGEMAEFIEVTGKDWRDFGENPLKIGG